MKKKYLASLITIFVAIASILCPTNIKPAKTQSIQPEIRIEPQIYNASAPGEIFNISVNIYDVQVEHRMVTAQFRIGYDPSILQVVGVLEGPFMQSFNNTNTPPYTLFVYFIEDDPLYGPNIIVGIVIYPNETGIWTNFPYGDGTLAIITFKAISQLWHPLSCDLRLFDTLLVNDDAESIDHTIVSGEYSMSGKPLSITYKPAKPSVGEVVCFESNRYFYGDTVVKYEWSFGDGYEMTTYDPVVHHVYATPGSYNVSLTVTVGGETANTTAPILVGFYPSLTIDIEADSTYIRRETVEFYILVSNYGKGVSATYMEALLYYNGTIYANLTDSIETIRDGLYMIQYTLPADASIGTYTLLVNVEYYDLCGTAMKSFRVRAVDLTPVLLAFGAASGMPGWNAAYDINGNGKNDGLDIAFICRYFM